MPTRNAARAASLPADCTDLPVDRLSELDHFEMPATHLNRKAIARARNANLARACSHRRRMVDPTTCDVEYSAAQLEFMLAMQAYKQEHCRPYPNCTEVLAVLAALGYAKCPSTAQGTPRRRQASGRRTDSADAVRTELRPK